MKFVRDKIAWKDLTPLLRMATIGGFIYFIAMLFALIFIMVVWTVG